jgi:hypothetical protein
VIGTGRWGEWDTPDGERNQITLADTTEQLIGDGAMRLNYWVRAPHHGGWWGGGAWIEHYAPAGEHLPDLSTSTHFLVWYKILAAKADSGSYEYLQLRMQLFDDSDGAREQWYHKTTVRLDNLSSGWNLLSVPIVDLGLDQDNLPSTGFTLPSWEGYKGNGILNLNSLAGWKFEIVGDGALLYTSGTLLMDHLVAVGAREVVVDTTPPDAPQSVAAVPDANEKFNLVVWQDVPNESGGKYAVYASQAPITDVTAPEVEVLTNNVAENIQTFVHFLYNPLVDKEVTYYYAVTARDKAGNVGAAGVAAAAVTNMAKGVPTISLSIPANVVIDGNLSEWESSGIMPFVFKKSTSHVGSGAFDNDDDYNATMYMAMDNEYFYFAVDAIDNIHSFDPAGNWWEDDAIEMFFGLYDGRPGPPHGARLRGAKPDYALQFRYDGLFHPDNSNRQIYGRDSSNYYFEGFGSDYIIETKIKLSDITFGDDAPFVLVNGTRIPLDFSIHDSDVANVRDGILTLSPINNDNSWQSPRNWTYVWIGDRETPVAVEDTPTNVPLAYNLGQNYPNPFNPTTKIKYSLRVSGQVKIELFNTIGQKVRTLVDEVKPAGVHTLDVNVSNLPTGIYFYRIHAGDFKQTRKMLLMK